MEELVVKPLLEQITAQAADADSTRSVSPDVIMALKANPIMSFTAAEQINGLNQSIETTGYELEAVAGCCASTAWVLWNHLATFHLFCGLLGPNNSSQLQAIVESREWVCFPAGASTGVRGVLDKAIWSLEGKAAFGSGARYADWAGVSFVPTGEQAPRFSLVDLHQSGVNIDADWKAMSLRASATDTVYYENANVVDAHVVPFHFMYREVFRDPTYSVIHPRYREDWVAISDLWLGMMAVGLLQQTIDELVTGIKNRIAIAGVKVAERPTVHVNLGIAQANINTARDTVVLASRETDERIAAHKTPTEGDYLRQLAASMSAIRLCDEALKLLVRVNGGNGLREGQPFERHLRDFQAMPLHINAHQDRVSEQFGRHQLGLEAQNPF